MGPSRPHLLAIAMAALAVSMVASGCLQQLTGRPVAYDFIRDDRYTSLLIEVDYVPGRQPHSDAVALLEQRARERLMKPEGVSSQVSAAGEGRSRWTVDDLRAYESDHRNFRPQGTRMVLYVAYVNGEFSPDSEVIGVHYGPTSVAIFKEKITGSSLTGVTTRDAERAVLVHEFGHVIGLVNIQIPMGRDREDPESRGHSTNRNSVMYRAVQTSEISLLTGTPPNQFDPDDIADIRAAGGK